jgi:hypothetical protein
MRLFDVIFLMALICIKYLYGEQFLSFQQFFSPYSVRTLTVLCWTCADLQNFISCNHEVDKRDRRKSLNCWIGLNPYLYQSIIISKFTHPNLY